MRTIFTRVCLVTMVCGLAHGDVRAQSYGTELPFILGTSTRASAMGVTSVSFVPDASIQYYNPSVMSSLQWKQFSFSRTTLFESSSLYHTLSYSHPLLNYGTIGLSVLRLDVGGIEERDRSNQLLSSDLSNSQTRVLLGYGRSIGSAFAAGFNLVFDNHQFGEYSGAGVGLDIGISAQQSFAGQSMIRGIREGFVIKNILEPSVQLDQEKVSDPMNIGVGVSVLSVVGDVRMITSIDLVNPRFSPTSFRIGQEFTYAERYSLRVGVDETTPTFGAGAEYKNLALDYAFRSEDFGENHRISLSVRFGSSVDEQRAQIRTRREQQINETINSRMDDLEQAQVAGSLSEGKKLLAETDYPTAISRFEIALLWDPDNEEARRLAQKARYEQAMQLGHGAMNNEDYASALLFFKNASRFTTDPTEADKMTKLCNQWLRADADLAASINQLLNTAIDLYAERQFSQALSGFTEILKLDPMNSLALEYSKKCEINIATRVRQYVSNARSLAARSDYESSIRLLEQALADDPDNTGVLVELDRVRALHAGRDSATARPIVTATPKTGDLGKVNRPALERKYAEGMTAFNKGDFAKAIRSLSEVWSQEPEFHNVSTLLVKAYLLVGMNHYSDQEYAKAIRVWERALTVDPNSSKAKRYISKANEIVRTLGGKNND